ncbi:terminase large subunit domain-containing protein [Rhodococcus sp. LW-XY12]|uniref:terminase large subunit domain-containing protein n=1 Tax=Rhodococcus sp. LW-XY12 TaxID=2856851 RepID=UPI001C566E94|nr:terminase family protein [Rhodococcus sp. LW-XY12]QXU55218.1 terminase large subunit [Rhodococcus sp. LW-XY12]
MTATIDRSLIRAARDDIDVFAREIARAPLWPHQLELARSSAKIRAVCSGRQAGKSRTLAVLALHEAFSRPGSRTLVLSAGEEAAKLVLASIAELLSSPLLAGAAVEENKSRILLSTGSEIVSVPASTRQVRGRSIDLLILDEANFMDEALWTAAKFTVIARPGSRIVMASSPWTTDHFFHRQWQTGRLDPSDRAESFHWPSTASPLVDAELLEDFRKTMTAREYAREVDAEWIDDAGSYFTAAELDDNTADYALIPPDKAHGQAAVAGVDWGFNDSNALVLLGVLDDGELNRGRFQNDLVYFLPWLEHHSKMPYSTFIDRIATVARGYDLVRVISETNGVGQMPTQVLRNTIDRQEWTSSRRRTQVTAVTTDNRRKTSGYGALKVLLQQGRIVLPRHPELLKQLHALTYEMTPTGAVRIEVPEHAGHDDLADALMQVMAATESGFQSWRPDDPRPRRCEVLTTAAGTHIPSEPRCWDLPYALMRVRGMDKGDGW